MTFVHRCVQSLAKSPLSPFVKGGAQRTGDLSPQMMCTNLAWSDLEENIEEAYRLMVEAEEPNPRPGAQTKEIELNEAL